MILNMFDNLSSSSLTNKKEEIRYLFDKLKFKQNPSELFSYYQGCGSDLCTLAISSINNHVFSDIDDSKNSINEVLHSLQNDAENNLEIISETSECWHVKIDGIVKNIYFTRENISQFNFNKRHGKLGLVFTFNSGDSTYKKSFWKSISNYLIPGGIVIGNSADISKLDRHTIYLKKIDNGYMLYDHIKMMTSLDAKYLDVKKYISEKNFPSIPFESLHNIKYNIIEIGQSQYLFYIYDFPLRMKLLGKNYGIFEIMSSNLKDYQLTFKEGKNGIVALQKNN